MVITPLYNPLDMQNFPVGEPYWFAQPGQKCCACDRYTYDGTDARLQFPRGYHVRAGKGTKRSGGVHQDCDLFEPDRVRVIPLMTPYGVTVNVIRLEGDSLLRSGGAMLLRPFDEHVYWNEQGAGVRAVAIFKPSGEGDTPRLYASFGLRGELSFAPTKESVEILEVAILDGSVKLLWWHDGIEGEGNRYRKGQELEFDFRRDEWYQMTLRVLPVADAPNTWDARVKIVALRSRSHHLVWNCPIADRMNQGLKISQLAFGDEHQNMTDGGVFFVSRLAAEKIVV